MSSELVHNGATVESLAVAPPGAADLVDSAVLLELAEADAASAEADAAAARARAAAIRLRCRLNAGSTGPSIEPAQVLPEDEEPDTAGRTRWLARSGIRPRRPKVLRILAGLAVLACAASAGLLYWQHQQSVRAAERTVAFKSIATEAVMALTSLDFANSTDDVRRVLDVSTGAFKRDFEARSEDFRKIVEESKVVSQGHVFATAVESQSDDSAVVLVAATSEITSPPDAKEPPRAWRLAVDVARDGDVLKVAKVEFVK